MRYQWKLLLWVNLIALAGCDVVAEARKDRAPADDNQQLAAMAQKQLPLIKNSLAMVDSMTNSVGVGSSSPEAKPSVLSLLFDVVDQIGVLETSRNAATGQFSISARSAALPKANAPISIIMSGEEKDGSQDISSFGVVLRDKTDEHTYFGFTFFRKVKDEEGSRSVLNLSESRRFAEKVAELYAHETADIKFEGSLVASIDEGRSVLASENLSYSNDYYMLTFPVFELRSEEGGRRIENAELKGQIFDRKRPDVDPGIVEVMLDRSREKIWDIQIRNMPDFELPQGSVDVGDVSL